MLTVLTLCLFGIRYSAQDSWHSTEIGFINPTCSHYTFMCRKTHHPLCRLTRKKSADGQTCTTRVTCDQDDNNEYSQSAVCYGSGKAFMLPRQNDLNAYDRIMFSYSVNVKDENGQELPHKLQGANSANNAPVDVAMFLKHYKSQMKISEFRIQSNYPCWNISMCVIND